MKSIYVLGVIPARGGSKGIRHKNRVPLGGKPLLRWTVEAAHRSRRLSAVLVSTDSPELRRLAERSGCPAPFLRPKALATDRARTLDVIRHAIEWHEADIGRPIDAVLVLQPTSPFRNAQDIDRCIELLARSPKADSVISFQDVAHAHPRYLYIVKSRWAVPLLHREKQGVPRQDFETVYVRNGAIYLARRATLFNGGSLWGRRILPYFMPPERSVNIDNPFDLRLAEGLLRVRR